MRIIDWSSDVFSSGLYHGSSAESGADSPFGSNNVIGTAAFARGVTNVDFSGDFPVLSVLLPPGMSTVGPDQMMVTGSSFRNSYMKSEVDQAQVRGSFDFEIGRASCRERVCQYV